MAVEFLDTGVLYREDNLTALTKLPEESIDLVYLDPPFFSNRTYEVIWGDEAEVRSFEDRWEGGIQVYINWMRDRAIQLHRVLKPTGALYLHCDPHASHYLKVMLDQVFGSMDNFCNEIIWKRTTAHNSAKRYGPVHDVIRFYSKNPKLWTWNQQHQAYSPGYIDKKYRHIEAGSGSRYRLSDLTGSGTRKGESGTEWRGFNPTSIGRNCAISSYLYDRYEKTTGASLTGLPLAEVLDNLDGVALIVWPKKKDGKPEHKRYLDDMPGVLQDVWTDIDPINARAAERLGYPTQKPEALLARLIRASTSPGDTILDPFCGCGTTISVAQQLGRKWIGIDISTTAVNIMKARLVRISSTSGVKVIGLPDDEKSLRVLKPFEFQNWVIQKFVGTHSPRKLGDMGIDGYSFMEGNPIQVKRSDHVGRDVVDNFETAIRREGRQVGYIVGFSFTRGAREEVARVRWAPDPLEIRLLTVADLLKPQLPDRIPELATVTELPMPPSRPIDALPSADELIRSDLAG